MAADTAPQGNDVAQVQLLEERVRELEQEVAQLRRRPVEHLQAIIDLAPLTIYLKDARGVYLLVNREYERLSARPRDKTLGRTDFDIFEQPVAQLFRGQDAEVIAKGCSVEFKETIPLPDGVHTFITAKFPLRSQAGELLGVAGMCTDITELQGARDDLEKAQAELVRQARLATLGELAAVVAHEVRNPLGVVFNAVAALKRSPALGEPKCREMLEIIGAEADRLNRMVGALLELARPPQASFGPTLVERMVTGAIDGAKSLAEPGAEVRLELPAPIPESCLDEHLVRQALGNLVCNALQAPGRKGPVVVRVELVARQEEPALRFAVVDDGAGVPAELADRIFAPFFTTRAAGTGLGLTVARRVAEAHRGTVVLSGTPGGGATFTLEIPFVPPLPVG